MFTSSFTFLGALAWSAAASNGFQLMHVLNEHFTGAANKNLGNDKCVVGFIAEYAFGARPQYSAVNSEMHIDSTVVELVWFNVNQWSTGPGRYVSCCPPHSTTNPGNVYRCNTWAGDSYDNCHTKGLQFNDGTVKGVGYRSYQDDTVHMYSFPAEGEGTAWTQGLTRRVKTTTIVQQWIQTAGGCSECSGDWEQPCWGSCVKRLPLQVLSQIADNVLSDSKAYPNQPIPGTNMLVFMGGNLASGKYCMDLAGGNSASGNPASIDLWQCNGLVNQMWFLANDGSIILGGSNGVCLDLPGGQVGNGKNLWLWGCNGQSSQKWEIVQDGQWSNIKYRADSRYCLDVAGNHAWNGLKLWIWECNTGHPSQLWAAQSAVSWNGHATGAGKNLSRNSSVNWTSLAWQEGREDSYAIQMQHMYPLAPDGRHGYNITTQNMIVV